MAAADTPNLPDGAEGIRPDRRTVLRGMSAMGLAAFAVPLAGHGDNATTAAPEAGREANPKPTPKPSGKAPAAKGKLVKASNTPLATTAEIPVNSGMLFEADEYIVTQPKAGKFVGFDSLCTHEGCPVDVFDTPGEMDCSCHSSKFKLDTGKPFAGPAKKPLPKKPIIIENGNIYKAKPA
jgi:Rieske Fe-S protein